MDKEAKTLSFRLSNSLACRTQGWHRAQDNHQVSLRMVCTRCWAGAKKGLSGVCRAGLGPRGILLHLGGAGMWPECPVSMVFALSQVGLQTLHPLMPPSPSPRSQICSEIPTLASPICSGRSNPSLVHRALGQGVDPGTWRKRASLRGKCGCKPSLHFKSCNPDSLQACQTACPALPGALF